MIGETIVCLLSGQQTTTVSSKYCTAAVLRALLVMVHLYNTSSFVQYELMERAV